MNGMGGADLFERVPDAVSVYEVSPRDGLQNENTTVPLSGKLRLIDALIAAGLRRIEITSFVSPRWIPQLADADEVAEVVVGGHDHGHGAHGGLSARAGAADVDFSALCPNPQGLERAKRAGMKEIAVFL